MSIALYMDHHVKAAVTEGLRRRGVDVITCADDGAGQTRDEAILQRATDLGRVVFTQDDDFLAIAREWLKNRRNFAGIIYAHQTQITTGEAIRDLELAAKVFEPAEMLNRIEFLPY